LGFPEDKSNEPHVRCNLKFCNPCSAHSKRTGLLCKQPAMKNGKCRFHGGKATGPKTPEGLKRSQGANLKHGRYSQEWRAVNKALDKLRKYVLYLDLCMVPVEPKQFKTSYNLEYHWEEF
jgi:hypothetical protein